MWLVQEKKRFEIWVILSPQGRQQSPSLGRNPISTMLCRVSHVTMLSEIVLCDEYQKSILLVVCHMPGSIL